MEFDEESNVLEVCRKASVEMPNFCFHSDLSIYDACRMCMAEEGGTVRVEVAHTMPPYDRLHIRTNMAHPF